MPSTFPTDLMLDYYAQYCEQWIALPVELLDARPTGPCLWLGGYLGLMQRLHHTPDVIGDLDLGVLRRARRATACGLAVQCDIRELPFHRCFKRILVPGCVSAYLLDDHAVTRAAASLASALDRRGGNTLWLDAYLRDDILDSDYFNGQRTLHLLGQTWHLQASSRLLSQQPWIFEASLCFTTPGNAPVHLSFLQRAFHESELIALLHAQGFVTQHSQHANGRLGLLLERTSTYGWPGQVNFAATEHGRFDDRGLQAGC